MAEGRGLGGRDQGCNETPGHLHPDATFEWNFMPHPTPSCKSSILKFLPQIYSIQAHTCYKHHP
ncbi:unnamed protein product [Nyctereutes procyonoides]|uniref:(raccoon dog) hypothetical protein n=1 Tax=Nyctereutes procyonoides TaxID=34880 RepID=A0A811ZP33_NYCPR|nr:unnamed protein product [Nyctereutes procyonoides]